MHIKNKNANQNSAVILEDFGPMSFTVGGPTCQDRNQAPTNVYYCSRQLKVNAVFFMNISVNLCFLKISETSFMNM